MTYAELVASIKYYTENTEADFVTEIPTFVKQTEDRIFHIVDHLPVFRKGATTTVTASSAYLATPSDFIFPYSLAVLTGTTTTYLLNKDVTFIRAAYPDASVEGEPVYYALWDDNTFIMAPTPDTTYTAQIDYTYKPESIVTASTSWLGSNAESTLLYGCLVEAYTFMKGEDDLIKLYMGRYQEALERLKVLADAHVRKDAYRAGQIRRAEA
jgi:hypothetical protein